MLPVFMFGGLALVTQLGGGVAAYAMISLGFLEVRRCQHHLPQPTQIHIFSYAVPCSNLSRCGLLTD